MGKKISDLIPILSKITRPVAAIKSLRFASLSFFNPKKTSWGHLGPVAYESYLHMCIRKESFSPETVCIPEEYCFT